MKCECVHPARIPFKCYSVVTQYVDNVLGFEYENTI